MTIKEAPSTLFREGATVSLELTGPEATSCAFTTIATAGHGLRVDECALWNRSYCARDMPVLIDNMHEEFESKNWVLIPIKFALWIGFLTMVFVFMRKGLITPKIRRTFYLVAVAVFGVILGSDPSPMGTVKDAVVLLGTKGVIFPPRMIALTIFLATVFLANKFICSWGCPFGALQDAIFRLNRKKKDTTGIFFQAKLPFVVTNTIRIATFAVLAIVAFAWGFDIIGAVDPFKIVSSAESVGGFQLPTGVNHCKYMRMCPFIRHRNPVSEFNAGSQGQAILPSPYLERAFLF